MVSRESSIIYWYCENPPRHIGVVRILHDILVSRESSSTYWCRKNPPRDIGVARILYRAEPHFLILSNIDPGCPTQACNLSLSPGLSARLNHTS
ncbi:hypothetical protein RRG08_029081 [Elysia crispata]|uniref:Uncharacterized protein n=1 Tax=Elysia crispata TaxID=231223 RepID=A0AAE0ZLA9_9GAST|nr:hypothetical protein RRG08_029081 [Elysia crispata]